MRQVETYRVRARTLADDDVYGVVLHRGVEYLLHRAVEAVNLVHEQYVVFLQVGQQCGEVTRLFDGRTGGYAQVYAHLVGDYPRKCGLAQSRGAVQKHVVEGFAAHLGGLDEDAQIVLGLLLAYVLVKGAGTERVLVGVFRQYRGRGYQPLPAFV